MKHRISPATIIATVALFFSLGGVGIAATGYRITSIFQIAPKVRHELRGQRGPRGARGPQGPPGSSSVPVVSGPPTTQATDPPTNPRVAFYPTCAGANIDYAGFGTTPQPLTVTWTDDGISVETQTVETNLPEADDNIVEMIAVAAPKIPAGDVLGLSVSWTFGGGGHTGPITAVAYC